MSVFLSRICFVFFFKQKTAYEMRISDWSSDVCSSDLVVKLGILDSDSALHPVFDHGLAGARGLQPHDIWRIGGRFRYVAIAPTAVIAKRLPGCAPVGAHRLKPFQSEERRAGKEGFRTF